MCAHQTTLAQPHSPSDWEDSSAAPLQMTRSSSRTTPLLLPAADTALWPRAAVRARQVPGLHYSYDTCEATDTFTDFYTQRNGEINICSVFSEHANALSEAADGHERRTCGNTDTLTQVEAATQS